MREAFVASPILADSLFTFLLIQPNYSDHENSRRFKFLMQTIIISDLMFLFLENS